MLASGASAHGGGAARGYASAVKAITPGTPGLSAQVLEGDDRIELTVRGDHVVVVDGYESEPYLRFSPAGVYRNTRSPATYLNDDRYGRVALPAVADVHATPVWEKVGNAGRPYDWHDHRIHWMSESYPPLVAADTSKPRHLLDWVVPGTIDGAALTITGSLGYVPPPGQRFPRVLIVPLVVLSVVAVALPLLRRRTALTAAARRGRDVQQ